MLGFFRGKGKRKENKNENIIYTPCKGTVVPITEVPDPVFSEKVLGDGFAVIPAEGKIYAPTDGEVTLVFDTLHAVGMTSSMGTEILIHIGLDTVTLGGELVKDGTLSVVKAAAKAEMTVEQFEKELDKFTKLSEDSGK